MKCKVRQQSNRRPSESARVQRSDSAVRQSLKIVKLVRIKVSRTLKSPSRTLFSTRKSDKNAKWSDNSVGLFLVRRGPIRSPIGLDSVRSDSDGLRRSQKGVKVASDCFWSPSESDRTPTESVGVRKWSVGRPTESVGPEVILYTCPSNIRERVRVLRTLTLAPILRIDLEVRGSQSWTCILFGSWSLSVQQVVILNRKYYLLQNISRFFSIRQNSMKYRRNFPFV